MLDGIDIEKDPMGIIRHEEFVCGTCRHIMVPLSSNRYQCPKCGMTFDDSNPA